MDNIKIGDTVKIIKMEGEPQYTNREGVVTHIDDAGQIHGTWGGCASFLRLISLLYYKELDHRGQALFTFITYYRNRVSFIVSFYIPEEWQAKLSALPVQIP